MNTDRYTYSLRNVNSGQFLATLSPAQAMDKDLDHPTWAVYVEKNAGRPYRVHGWDEFARPLVKGEYDKQLLPL